MNEPMEAYNETTDLYKEILRGEAQRIEDKRLIRIIQQRLKSLGNVSCFTSSGCEVIYFPGSMALPIEPCEDRPFWPQIRSHPDCDHFDCLPVVDNHPLDLATIASAFTHLSISYRSVGPFPYPRHIIYVTY